MRVRATFRASLSPRRTRTTRHVLCFPPAGLAVFECLRRSPRRRLTCSSVAGRSRAYAYCAARRCPPARGYKPWPARRPRRRRRPSSARAAARRGRGRAAPCCARAAAMRRPCARRGDRRRPPLGSWTRIAVTRRRAGGFVRRRASAPLPRVAERAAARVADELAFFHAVAAAGRRGARGSRRAASAPADARAKHAGHCFRGSDARASCAFAALARGGILRARAAPASVNATHAARARGRRAPRRLLDADHARGILCAHRPMATSSCGSSSPRPLRRWRQRCLGPATRRALLGGDDDDDAAAERGLAVDVRLVPGAPRASGSRTGTPRGRGSAGAVPLGRRRLCRAAATWSRRPAGRPSWRRRRPADATTRRSRRRRARGAARRSRRRRRGRRRRGARALFDARARGAGRRRRRVAVSARLF